ncbi:hypothetical protein V5P93_006680 [Actinokineospora auranticolor]|uniref:hypothetical protein n=1 Tax=Actinokineospora auranticolor TaxID=155976 RepID=UPI0011B01FA4|nr:hypothetical protein [Actinokineospora auranticolor]
MGLQGLRNVAEAGLQQLFTDAFAEQNKRFDQTLSRLESNDAEAATLLRELRAEIEQLRSGGRAVDFDAAAMLSEASRKLAGLPDYAPMLNKAAHKLSGLEGLVVALGKVVRKLPDR